MVIDPFSMILLPAMINIVTGPIDPKVLLERFKSRRTPLNHDLQKAIKTAYLQALIDIAEECKAGNIQSFRLYLPTAIDQQIQQWKDELEQIKKADNETLIAPPLQNTAEIEELLLSHGTGEQVQGLETRLVAQALQGLDHLPEDYQNEVQTGLFAKIYAHFVEQLKTNERAYKAFELEYLTTINASITGLGVGQQQVVLTMQDILSVVNRTDENLQKIVNHLSPKSLTEEEWRDICRQRLTEQKQLTTNPFSNAYGVTAQLDEIYVPLAIVERKLPKPPSLGQPEEKETETLIPIAEDRFFEEVLRQGKSEKSSGRKIAIIGEPGSGKTTRLQKIGDWILDQELGLPIWVSLADVTQPTLTHYIEDIWLKQTGQTLTIEQLTQYKHRIWLLLDGVDEMTSRLEMRHVSALLGGWVQNARVVVTCRVNVWEADQNAFSGFDVFRNLAFNPQQVTDYIRCWFGGMGDVATGESLEAALARSENSRLKELIQNPLRLWMLCQIWHTGGGLPETQAELYREFVEWVYRWKADDEILDQREAMNTALARLALAAMEQQDEASRFRLSESWVMKVLGSRPIFQAVMKLGWLNRVERFPEAICVFYHATFQEYFAACAIEDWDYFLPRNHVDFPVTGKKYRIFEPQWKQVYLLWMGRRDVDKDEKEGLIQKLVNFDDGCSKVRFEDADRGFYEYQAYLIAASGITELKTCSLRDEIIKQLFSWENRHFTSLLGEKVARTLIAIGFNLTTVYKKSRVLEAPRYQTTNVNESEILKHLLWLISQKVDYPNFYYEYAQTVREDLPGDSIIKRKIVLNWIHQVNWVKTADYNNATKSFIEYLKSQYSDLNEYVAISDNTIVATNKPFFRSTTEITALFNLTLENLPQSLTQAIDNNPELCSKVQPLYIDGSKFIDPENPAIDIYGQLLDQNCPERSNGDPETLPQLKSYCAQLRRNSNKHPILIFYENPAPPTPQGFSETFLNVLTRFDSTICLITDLPYATLPTFSPQDPHLIQTIMNWLQRTILEA